MNKHWYEYDEVVVGNDLNAVLYSYINNVPILLNNINKPLFFEFLPYEFDVSKLNLRLTGYELQGLSSVKNVGPSKLEMWERLLFLLSLSGMAPLSNKIESIRVEENILKVTTQNFKIARIRFNKLRIFDDENVSGLDIPTKSSDMYKVVDWVDVRSGMVHAYDYFETEDDLVKEIYFYPSFRIDGGADRKDLVVISYMNEEQLNDFDYSDTMVKFKTLNLMKEAGIRGARNGRDQNNPEKYKYYAVKIQTRKRELRKIKFSKYDDSENIFFDYRTVEEIYNDLKLSSTYCNKLNGLISKR
tara:strand:+ start:1452 stop:2354 length:903 start_codon:yes stop_codon:yes gene_type:complete